MLDETDSSGDEDESDAIAVCRPIPAVFATDDLAPLPDRLGRNPSVVIPVKYSAVHTPTPTTTTTAATTSRNNVHRQHRTHANDDDGAAAADVSLPLGRRAV